MSKKCLVDIVILNTRQLPNGFCVESCREAFEIETGMKAVMERMKGSRGVPNTAGEIRVSCG